MSIVIEFLVSTTLDDLNKKAVLTEIINMTVIIVEESGGMNIYYILKRFFVAQLASSFVFYHVLVCCPMNKHSSSSLLHYYALLSFLLISTILYSLTLIFKLSIKGAFSRVKKTIFNYFVGSKTTQQARSTVARGCLVGNQ